MTALMPEESRTQAEEIIMRFKTTRPRGLLLATSLETSVDRLQIYLEEGKAKMLIHIGEGEKVRGHSYLAEFNCEGDAGKQERESPDYHKNERAFLRMENDPPRRNGNGTSLTEGTIKRGH